MTSKSYQLPAGLGYRFFNSQFTKAVYPPKGTSLAGQTGILTGGNQGLGFAAANSLLALGLTRLIIAVRTVHKGEAAAAQLKKKFPKAVVDVWQVDMLSYKSIQDFAAKCQTLQTIDFAILNAGTAETDHKLSPEGHETMFQVNYLSTVLLAFLLLPTLKARSPAGKPGHLTIINSGTALIAKFPNAKDDQVLAYYDKKSNWDSVAFYSASKGLAHFWILKLVEWVHPEDVVVNLVDPGLVKGTQLHREASWFLSAIAGSVKSIFGRTMEEGASCFVDAAVIRGPETHGCYLQDWKIFPYTTPVYGVEGKALADKIWNETLALLSFANVDEILASMSRCSSHQAAKPEVADHQRVTAVSGRVGISHLYFVLGTAHQCSDSQTARQPPILAAAKSVCLRVFGAVSRLGTWQRLGPIGTISSTCTNVPTCAVVPPVLVPSHPSSGLDVSATATATPAPTVTARHPIHGPLYTQTRNNKTVIRRVKRKPDGNLKSFSRWLLENQTGLSFNLFALLFLTHLFMPKARPVTSKFFTLSHYNPNTGNYAVGEGDLYFISFVVVLLTGLRAGFLEHILAPLARYLGVTKKGDIVRFSEQTWLLCYYAIFYTLGVYIYCTSKYFLNMRELWTDWPHRELPWITKFYILGQWAFWVQQVLVINIEERRKDHWQMLTHHFVTIALISTSYAIHLTRVGNLILVLMDVVDIFFPIAKCLKYTGHNKLCDLMFGMFVLSWFMARHVLYMTTMWSLWAHMPEMLPVGCFHGSQDNLTGPTPLPLTGWSHALEPFRNPTGTICYSDNVRLVYLGALGFLQLITIFWFFMIVRVAVRVISGHGADDPRSDDEVSEESEYEYEYEEAQPLEEEVGVESIDLKNWERSAGAKRAATSSGVGLSGHGDRKELLGRIGCDKQVE
ncbi:hypothetical protein G7046_g1893 [Stylonectria norvegica]|nr:hypothetical protein G7046_g1893 [Stylonectria norvegica]